MKYQNAAEVTDVFFGSEWGNQPMTIAEIGEYFTVANIVEMFGSCDETQDELDELAAIVVAAYGSDPAYILD